VALFGSSPPEQWHPWGVAHRVVRASSKNVNDIPLHEVVEATLALLQLSLPHAIA
jgi:heptosyltransferase III